VAITLAYNIHHVMSSQATGGSAMKAVEVLIEHHVPEERIIFINLVRALEDQIQNLSKVLNLLCS
jgi:uracil phosphoribosyltransferase